LQVKYDIYIFLTFFPFTNVNLKIKEL